jgi:hypothetical protein
MSFSKESDMYNNIAEFLKNHFPGCKTVIDKITFDMLKGWKIDVVGIIHKRNNYVIAIEAKNDMSSGSILQGISQAEMYQKACNESYIALPSDGISDFRKSNKDDWDRIIDLCKLKGIGILSVEMQWQDCRILCEAMKVERYLDLHEDILNQLEYETLTNFEGFEESDFDYFTGRADWRKPVLRKRIELLVEEIKREILANPRDFPAIDSRKLVVSLPSTGLRDHGCWFFAAEVEREKLAYSPHFTFNIDNSGVSCELNLGESQITNTKFIPKISSHLKDFLALS